MKTCEIEARLKVGNEIIGERDVTKANYERLTLNHCNSILWVSNQLDE